MNPNFYRPFLWPLLLPIRFVNGYRSRRYLPLLKFEYAENIESRVVRRYPILVAEHFARLGRKQILKGERRLSFEFEGRRSDYVESAYLAANPDVADLVNAGALPDGLEHFLTTGWDEVQAGVRRPYPAECLLSVERVIEGSGGGGKYLCYFAHYDVDDKVDPYVLHALKAFHELGCEIVFCTGTLADSEFEKLLPLVRYVVVRNRFGYDFTSWVAGVTAQVPVGDFERVIFTNDSFFFPVGSPGAMFDAMAASEAGLWGLTDSYQGWERPRFHLQSYFLAMRGSELIERLVDKYRLIGVLCRRGVIEEFELWFSAEAEREGMAVEGMVKADELVKSARMAPLYLNPTVHCWRELLVSKKCPILKVAVVRDNPVRNFSLKDFEGLKLDYPVGLIEGYLARVKGKARGEFRRG